MLTLVAERTQPAVRQLTEDERWMLTHVTMFGAAGYPVSKVGSRHWSWSYRGVSSPRVFPTKRDAIASFESHVQVLRMYLAAEREARDRALELLGFAREAR